MNFLDGILFALFAEADKSAPLMVPDSVQKANFAEMVRKLANLDVDQLLQNLLSESVWILIKVLIALAIYFVGRWIVRRIIHLLDAVCERRRVDVSLRSFLRNTVRVVFTLLLVLIVVSTLGVNVTSLIAVFSAATLAIGMALSGTAQNFAGGVMILLMKPYRIGDYISAQGQSGTVREIKLFSTVITTVDNQTIYIPNNSIATAIIDNYSTADVRRVDWTVGISYGDDGPQDHPRHACGRSPRVARTGRAGGVGLGAGRQLGESHRARVDEELRFLGRLFRVQRAVLQGAASRGNQLPLPADGRACEERITLTQRYSYDYGTERDSGHFGAARTL